ncbi:MAG: hypothetical protein ACPL7O_01490 [Armatimonadota bacterium]
MADYLPKNVEEFESWLQNFVAGLTNHATELDVDVADLTALSTARTNLDSAIAEYVSKRSAAKAATANKNAKHQAAVDLARAMVRRISGNPNLTNEIREELGLNVRDENRTTSSVGPEVPGIRLEALPGRVIVHFGTDPSNERRNSKPAWATGCLIYRKRADESEFRLVGFQRTSPFVDDIVGAGADYMYFVRYQGKKGTDLGAESSVAMVAAGGLLAA